MNGKIWFDMDGTLFNLYDIPDWLARLNKNDMSVFDTPGFARRSIPEIRKVLNELTACGWEIGIITWSPVGVKPTDVQFRECYEYKHRWVEKYIPELATNFKMLEYGISKTTVTSGFGLQILVDDNKAVRADWRNKGTDYLTINANRGYIKELKGLLG